MERIDRVINPVEMSAMYFQNLRAFLILLLPGALLDCARFRIEELNPSRIFQMQAEARADAAQKGIHSNPYNFPIKPATDGSLFYLSDPEKKRVGVYNSAGELTDSIGKEAPSSPGVQHIPVDTGIPGWVAADGDFLFIQKRKPAAKGKEGKNEDHPELQRSGLQSARDFAPSVILVLQDERMIMEIGPGGRGSGEFERILRMDADDGKLYVLFTENGKKSFSVFEDGKPAAEIKDFSPGSAKEIQNYHREIEDIVPRAGSFHATASVVYRRKKDFRFQYRKIYDIDLATGKYEEIAWLDDPEEHFFWSLEDGGFYILHVEDDESSRILLRIYSATGEYLNNRQITLSGIRPAWRETFAAMDGKIYSSRIFKNSFEIYEWK